MTLVNRGDSYNIPENFVVDDEVSNSYHILPLGAWYDLNSHFYYHV